MKNKQGITIVILVITIILILILVGTLTVGVGNSIGNSRISAFASDLQEVEEMTKTYYMLNGKFPSMDDKVYNQGEILALVPSKYQGKFMEELQLNSDDVINDSDGTFYMIDLAKIDIEQSTRGTGLDEDGNAFESNVFVVSYPSMNVYYLEGLRANNEVFFSLSSKITQLTKITKEDTVEEGTTSLTTSNGIIVKKESDSWSNKLNITIESNMEEDESLYIQLGTGDKHLLTTVSGNNILQLKDNFTTIYSNTTNQETNSGITTDEINTFNSMSQEDKKITITKEKGGAVIGKVIVGLKNYENDLPGIASNVNVGYQPTYNYIYFNVDDKTSGIKQVKYEYLTRINADGESVPYFDNVRSYDDDYMKSRAKKATVSSNGLVEIQVPKDIEIVQINIFDKAGNSSAKINQRIISDTYIGINPTEITTTSVKMNLVAKVANGKNINSATVQISTDGINFSNVQNISFTSDLNGIYKARVNYTNLSNLPKTVYAKVILNYGNNEEFVRIKEMDPDSILVNTPNISALAVANFPTKYYGAKVTNYTTGNTAIDNQVEWQIFYSDEKYIYLIATDYVSNANLPKAIKKNDDGTTTELTLNTNGDYKAYFSNVLAAYNGSESITDVRLQALNNDYYNYLANSKTKSTNNNMKAVAYMMDTNIWSTFAGTYAEYAIGGPTVEMLFKSYNQKYVAEGIDYRTQVTALNGYQISKDGGTNWANSYAGMIKTSDTQYVINASDRKTEGMWLASPSASRVDSLVYMYCSGDVSNSHYINTTLGFRPIICLNSNVTLNQVGDGYEIVS